MKEFKNIRSVRICILTSPIGESGCIPTSNLVDIFTNLSRKVYLITGNYGADFFKKYENIELYGINHIESSSKVSRIIRYIYTQILISLKLKRISHNIDIFIFFMGADTLVLPMLIAKIFRKKVILVFAGSSSDTLKSSNDYLSYPLQILSRINCSFSDKIVLYSTNLIDEWNLQKYKHKISISHRHFLDFGKFRIIRHIWERDTLIGYVGRLSPEKGSMNFVHSIPLLLQKNNSLKFILIGDGSLRESIEKYLQENNLDDFVHIAGWVQHDDLPKYLNNLKLIVLPSYTEGLPNIMIEAMACGTPVLATPVGSIPDVIKDKETGFLLNNNSPESIADNVIRAIEYPYLANVTIKAKDLVEDEFTINAAIMRYRKIIEDL